VSIISHSAMPTSKTNKTAENTALTQPKQPIPSQDPIATTEKNVQSRNLSVEQNAVEQITTTTTIPDKTVEKVAMDKYPNPATTPKELNALQSIDSKSETINKQVEKTEQQPGVQQPPFVHDTTLVSVDKSSSIPTAQISNNDLVTHQPVLPANLSAIIKEPKYDDFSTISTINIVGSLTEVKSSSLISRVVSRPRPFITVAMTTTHLYESGQGARLSPQMSLYQSVFETSTNKFVPQNVSIMSMIPAWHEELFSQYGIRTINGNIVSESMYTKRYAPVNPIANSDLEEKTGRALAMLVMMYEPKPIVITPQEQLFTISDLNTGYDHLDVLNGRTILRPPSDSIALAVPGMRNSLVAQKLSERIKGAGWRIGRLRPIMDDNGVDVALIIADDIDHFTATAYNEVATHLTNQTLMATEIRDMIEYALIPGSTVQLIDTTDTAKYHHEFVTNPRASELVVMTACMQPEFARSLRPRIIKYLRSSGAITENLSGRAEDGASQEYGYFEFMTTFRRATPAECVDTFYSSQIPKVTLPRIRRHPVDSKHIYGIIPVYAAVMYAYLHPHLAFYARDEIARIIFDFGSMYFPKETSEFYAKYGQYNGIPGNAMKYDQKNGYAGNVPSIFLNFSETYPYYSDLANLMKYNKEPFTQSYDREHCARLVETNLCWPMFHQKVSDNADSRTPLELSMIVKVFEDILGRIGRQQKLQGSVIKTVLTYIRGNATALSKYVTAMETELAQLERKITTLPLMLGTHFQGDMSAPLGNIIGMKTNHPDYMAVPLLMEQIDPSWEIDLSTVLVSAYGLTMRLGDESNSTASSTIKLEQVLTFPDAIGEYFSQLGIISGLSVQLQPYGILNAIWSSKQNNPDIISLRHTTRIRDVDISEVVDRVAAVHQKAIMVGQSPPNFTVTGVIETGSTAVIETDPIQAFNNLRASAVDAEGNLYMRKSLLLDPQLNLYDRTHLELPIDEQVGPWAQRNVEFLSLWDKTRLPTYAKFVSPDSFLSRKRTGLLLLRRSITKWDPTARLNPNTIVTKDDEPFTILPLLPQNFGSKIRDGVSRSCITIADIDYINNEDFDGIIFQIANPAILSDSNRTWLVQLIQNVEFGVYLPNIMYTSIGVEMTHEQGIARQISLNDLLTIQEKTIHTIIFPDSRHILPTAYQAPIGQMFRDVYPIADDSIDILAKDWYQVYEKLSDNFKIPNPGYFDTGELTNDIQPSYTDGTIKTSVNALSMSNQIKVFLPSSRIGKTFKMRLTPPSSILPA